MTEGPQTITLGDATLAHTHDADTDSHVFEDGAGVYRLREWTWGQKNAATNASVVLDDSPGGFRIDTARFNEAMLAASLVEATVDGQPLDTGPGALRALPASQGDKLLGLAQWVNGLLADNLPADPRYDPARETYTLSLNGQGYVLREWTWGEKNDISSHTVVYDPGADRFRVDLALFSEQMLRTTLVEAPFPITLEALRGLPASRGDTLLQAAQQINGLAAAEKKRY